MDQRLGVVEPPLLARVGEVEVPVEPALDPAFLDPEVVAGRERVDPFEERPRSPRAEEAEEVIDSPGIGPGHDQSRRQQRLDLRAPQEPAVALGVIERADPHPVAAQDQRPLAAVPERDGELSPSPGEHPLAQVLVQVDPRLGVAPRRQVMAPRQQLGPQLLVLEQLAVERHPDVAGLVGDRLSAAGEVDDREPPRPSATPGSMCTCSSSGPRWAIAPVIARSRSAGNSRDPVKSNAPAIPHIVIPQKNETTQPSPSAGCGGANHHCIGC